MQETLRIPLRVVFYREDDEWVAHCLEFDLIGTGDSRQKAVERLAEAVILQIEATAEHSNPANLFAPADGKYLRMFAAGKEIAHAELEFKVRPSANVQIENAEYREYLGAGPVCV